MNLQTIFDPSTDRLINQAISSAVTAITHAWGEGRDAQIVLTGGRTGLKLAQSLDLALDRAIRNEKPRQDQKVNIWFSDERFVELESPDRTDTTIIGAFSHLANYVEFQRVLSPSQSSGETPLEKLESAANDYREKLNSLLGEKRFDCVILSMGEDGHIASSFPGDDEILKSGRQAEAVSDSPKPPSERVTLTLKQLAQTLAVYIFVLGAEKITPLKAVQERVNSAVVEQLRQNSTVGQIYLLTDQK